MATYQQPDDGRPMSPRRRFVLIVYLLGLGTFLVYALLRLNTVDFPDVALAIEAPPTNGVQPSSAPARPTSANAADSSQSARPQQPAGAARDTPSGGAAGRGGPQQGAAQTTGSAPTSPPARVVLVDAFPHLRPGPVPEYEVALYGSGFEEKSQVRLNGVIRTPKTAPRENLIRVDPTRSDLIGAGVLVVEVINPEGNVSNGLTLKVDRPKAQLRLLTFQWTISREMQLVLMVLFAGALGSLVHAVKSLADFIGNRTAITSWSWWYVTRPFLGGVLAFIVYAGLRGGFLTGTPADVRVINPFGAIAVAALVGMFPDKAAQKLAEIFDTLFKAEDRRSGKLGAPVIDKVDPATVRTGTKTPIELKIFGDRLGATRTIKIDGKERPPEKVSDKEVVLKLHPRRNGEVRPALG